MWRYVFGIHFYLTQNEIPCTWFKKHVLLILFYLIKDHIFLPIQLELSLIRVTPYNNERYFAIVNRNRVRCARHIEPADPAGISASANISRFNSQRWLDGCAGRGSRSMARVKGHNVGQMLARELHESKAREVLSVTCNF